jgi:cyclophilin family peptidyl-prolyl cis-trans isomerase
VHPEWAPLGAARFLDLVRARALDGTVLYRVVKNFLVQFGVPATAEGRAFVQGLPVLKDDAPQRPPPQPRFRRGMVSFAGGGKDSRRADMFIAFSDSESLGRMPWETPFGIVDADGMQVVASWESKYGDLKDFHGRAPDFGKLWRGYDFLASEYPDIDYLTTCTLVSDDGKAEPPLGLGDVGTLKITNADQSMEPQPAMWLLVAAFCIVSGVTCVLPHRSVRFKGGVKFKAIVSTVGLACGACAVGLLAPDVAHAIYIAYLRAAI